MKQSNIGTQIIRRLDVRIQIGGSLRCVRPMDRLVIAEADSMLAPMCLEEADMHLQRRQTIFWSSRAVFPHEPTTLELAVLNQARKHQAKP